MPETAEPNGSPTQRQELAYCFDCQDTFPDYETLRRHQNYMKQHRDRVESHPRIESSPGHGSTDTNSRLNGDNNNRVNETRVTAKGKGRRERNTQNHGKSSPNNTEGGSNGLDKEKNVLKKISLPCPYCKSKFDREDEFYLHHAVKHAKHGDPPKVTPIVDIISKPITEVKSNVIVQRRKSDVLRTPRPNITYNVDEESPDDTDSSSSSGDSDSDGNRSDVTKTSTDTSKNNENKEKQPGKICRRNSKTRNSSSSKTSSSNRENSNSEHDTDKSEEDAASIKKESKIKHKRKERLERRSSSNRVSDCENSLMALMLIVLKSSKHRKMFKKLLKSRHRKKLLRKRNKRNATIKCETCNVGISKKDLKRHQKMCKRISRNKTTDSGIPSSESEGNPTNTKAEDDRSKKNDKKKGKTPDRPKSAASDAEGRKRRPSQHSETEDTNNASRKRGHDNIENDKQKSKTPNREESAEDISHKRPRLDEPQQNVTKKRKVPLYRCDECDGHFITEKQIRNHIKPDTHYGVKTAECTDCKLKFGSNKILKDHKELHHKQLKLTRNDFTIVTNGMKFEPKKQSKPQTLNNPIVEGNASPVNKNKPTTAPVPQNLPSTSGQQNLNAQPPKQNNSPSTADRTLFKCVFCTALFLKRVAVHNHFSQTCSQKRPNEVMSTCEFCNLKFSRKSIKVHINIHHRKMKLGAKDFVIIICKPKHAGRTKKMAINTSQNSEIGEKSSRTLPKHTERIENMAPNTSQNSELRDKSSSNLPKHAESIENMAPNTFQNSEIRGKSPTNGKGKCVVKFTKNNGNAWSVASTPKASDGETQSNNTGLTPSETPIVTPKTTDTPIVEVPLNTDSIETSTNPGDNTSNQTQINTESSSVNEPTQENSGENVNEPPAGESDVTKNEGDNDEPFKDKLHIMTENNMVNIPFPVVSAPDGPEEYANEYDDALTKEENTFSEGIDVLESGNNNNEQFLNSDTKPDIEGLDTEIKTEESVSEIKIENVVSNYDDSNHDNQNNGTRPDDNIFSANFKYENDDEISNADSTDTILLKYEDDPINSETNCESTNVDVKPEIKEEPVTENDGTQRQSNTDDIEIKQEIVKTEPNLQNELKREIKEELDSNDNLVPETSNANPETEHINVPEGQSSSNETTEESNDDFISSHGLIMKNIFENTEWPEIRNMDQLFEHFKKSKSNKNHKLILDLRSAMKSNKDRVRKRMEELNKIHNNIPSKWSDKNVIAYNNALKEWQIYHYLLTIEINEEPNFNDYKAPGTSKANTETEHNNVGEGHILSDNTTNENDDLNTRALQLLEDIYEDIKLFVEEIANETLKPHTGPSESDKSKENDANATIDLTDDTTDNNQSNISTESIIEVPNNEVIAISDSDEDDELSQIRSMEELIEHLEKPRPTVSSPFSSNGDRDKHYEWIRNRMDRLLKKLRSFPPLAERSANQVTAYKNTLLEWETYDRLLLLNRLDSKTGKNKTKRYKDIVTSLFTSI